MVSQGLTSVTLRIAESGYEYPASNWSAFPPTLAPQRPAQRQIFQGDDSLSGLVALGMTLAEVRVLALV